MEVSHKLSAGRPCERRDPYPLALRLNKGLNGNAEIPRRMGPCVRRDDTFEMLRDYIGTAFPGMISKAEITELGPQQ